MFVEIFLSFARLEEAVKNGGGDSVAMWMIKDYAKSARRGSKGMWWKTSEDNLHHAIMPSDGFKIEPVTERNPIVIKDAGIWAEFKQHIPKQTTFNVIARFGDEPRLFRCESPEVVELVRQAHTKLAVEERHDS